MKAIVVTAILTAALMSWDPNAHAGTIIPIPADAQPLTKAVCDAAGLAWDQNANVCDWQAEAPTAGLGAEPVQEITAATRSTQPLTRADCDAAGLAWADNANVCDWTKRT